MNRITDINFNSAYLKAYEEHEGGVLEYFHYNCECGEAFVYYIKRPLSQFMGFEDYFDIVTPYGYGGQMIGHCEKGGETELVSRFNAAFEAHCRENKIVSYFARLNPIAENGPVFADFFDEMLASRKVVAMDLTKETVEEELTPKARSNGRASLRRGTEIKVESDPDSIPAFAALYRKVMASKNARAYYLFPDKYFNYLFEAFPDNIVLLSAQAQNQIILYEMVIVYGDIAYSHLTCRENGFDHYRANSAVNIAAAQFAKSRGCKYFVLGGGLSGDEADSLYCFKREFSISQPRVFYVGKKIIDFPIYRALCKAAEQKSGRFDCDYFPKYRGLLLGQ